MDKAKFTDRYCRAYGRYAASLKKTGKQDKLQKKVTTACQNIRDGKVLKMPSLYAHIAVLYAIALQTDDQSMLKKIKDAVRTLAKQDYNYIQNRQLEDDFCEYMLSKPSFLTKGTALPDKYQSYRQGLMKRQIAEMVTTEPTMEYPQARQMQRHFILHIGPTNSGKTHYALQMLMRAEHGTYLSPLRLLALEVYDLMAENQVNCTMVTGEETLYVENSTVTSQTIEMLAMDDEYDVAVIDEAQMIEDDFRGSNWVKAILGIRCPLIHVCASQDAEMILKRIIEKCNDTYEVVYHERKTELVLEAQPVSLKEKLAEDIREGDAIIMFSKRAVLDMAARLELSGISASVIYGHLPPEIRKKEVRKFLSGETHVVVSTDAIGMGLNLPIRRIVFGETVKFDGNERRVLKQQEILQIAGRAGRFGKYEKGYVTAGDEEGLLLIDSALKEPLKDIAYARLGFPKVLLSLDHPLDELLRTWESIPAGFPYKKIDVSEMLELYRILKKNSRDFMYLPEGDNKEVIFDMISCPLDIKSSAIVNKWCQYCMDYTADVSLTFPLFSARLGSNLLESYEIYYRMLDLYHNFSIRMGKIIDEERLKEERDRTDERITGILAGSKKSYIKRCRVCGKVLQLDDRFGICNECYEEEKRRAAENPVKRPSGRGQHGGHRKRHRGH